MEPGFYVCGKCSRRWSRQEYKLSSNPPRECPSCKDRSDQRVDQQRESDYTRDTYGGFVKALFTAPGKEEVHASSPAAASARDTWDPCFEEVLVVADEVGIDVSLDWTPRGTEVRTTVEGGCVVSVSLVPASVTCKLSFRKKSPPGVEGFRVELEASGPTSESCRDAVLSTLRAHRGLLASA